MSPATADSRYVVTGPVGEPTGEFVAGSRYLIKSETLPAGDRQVVTGDSRQIVVDEATDRVVACLPPAHGAGEIRTRTHTWGISVERPGRGWQVVIRDDRDDAIAAAYPRWRPGPVYDLWVAPDAWYRLATRPLSRAWVIGDADTKVARIVGARGAPDRIELTTEATAVAQLALLLVLAVETRRLEGEIPAMPGSGSGGGGV